MTDSWDELWENATVIDTDPNSWLGKVKAAGDDLVSINKGLLSLRKEYLSRVDTFHATEKKLKAIRKICLTMHRVNRQKALKILDGEGEEAS